MKVLLQTGQTESSRQVHAPPEKRFLINCNQFLAMILALLSSIYPCVADDLTTLRDIYNKNLQQIITQQEKAIKSVYVEFGKQLDEMESAAQASGNLEELMAIRKEKERFRRAHTVSQILTDSTNPEVAERIGAARSKLESLEDEKNKKIISLTSFYIKKLDDMKVDLTKKGQIEGAMAIKTEQAEVNGRPEVANAHFSLALSATEKKDADVTPTVSEAPAPPRPPEIPIASSSPGSMIACPTCNGTARMAEPCNTCRGTGHCDKCQGAGKRPSAMRGSNQLVVCLSCKGSGTCYTCNGNKTTGRTVACTRCSGTGRIAVPSYSSESYYSPNYTTMDLYSKVDSLPTTRMKSIDVMRDYRVHVGKLLETEGIVRGSGSRYIYVSELEPDGTSRSSMSFLPVNEMVRQELMKVSSDGPYGKAVKVKVKYTIQENGRRFILAVSKL